MPDHLYTKKGDKGETSLFNGEKIDKTSERVISYGTIDELNACLGVAKMFASAQVQNHIQHVQEVLFYLASELATRDENKIIRKINQSDVSELENIIDDLSEILPPAKHFSIPGGTKAGAFLHQARTVCRRAERNLLKLAKKEEVNSQIEAYLNRLSDFLYILSRYANIIDGDGDQIISREGVSWKKK